MEQLSIFNIPETPVQAANRQRDEGMARAVSNVSEEARTAALAIIRKLAETQATFTTDDVMAQILNLPADKQAKDNRFVGALVVKAQKEKWITGTGEYIKSVRRHSTPIPVWRSLIFKE